MEMATPRRRLLAWLIDILEIPLACCVALVTGFLAEVIWGDGPLGEWLGGGLLLAWVIHFAVLAGYISVWLLLVKKSQIGFWQMPAIFVPVTIVSTVFSIATDLAMFGWGVGLLTGIFVASFCTHIIGSLVMFVNGQTLGKLLAGVQVVSQTDQRSSWSMTFFREVVKAILHIFVIGLIIDAVMLLSDKAEHQSVADRIAGTVVVRVLR